MLKPDDGKNLIVQQDGHTVLEIGGIDLRHATSSLRATDIETWNRDMAGNGLDKLPDARHLPTN
jgi:hypothetical protein